MSKRKRSEHQAYQRFVLSKLLAALILASTAHNGYLYLMCDEFALQHHRDLQERSSSSLSHQSPRSSRNDWKVRKGRQKHKHNAYDRPSKSIPSNQTRRTKLFQSISVQFSTANKDSVNKADQYRRHDDNCTVPAFMKYWNDNSHGGSTVSEFHSVYETTSTQNEKQFLVFQPDYAGFNNVRMAFETMVVLAKITNRILVLPPAFQYPHFILTGQPYQFTDFFDLTKVETIEFSDYLETILLPNFPNESPPNNRTRFLDGRSNELFDWVESILPSITWQRNQCVVGFPDSRRNLSQVEAIFDEILRHDESDKVSPRIKPLRYFASPVPVDGSARDRLEELQAGRTQLCVYDEELQQAPSIYYSNSDLTGVRPLIPFHTFFFLQDWRQDVQLKRFVRDHLRYSNIIHCTAGRIVARLQKTMADSTYDAMHLRRADFMHWKQDGHVSGAAEFVREQFFAPNRTLYIATDEKDGGFFAPLKKHYNILFLSDFVHELGDVDPNLYGMIEQIVCAHAGTFVGTYLSTFSAYITRIRGYLANKNNWPGALKGGLERTEYMGHGGSYRYAMKKYVAVKPDSFWTREWPSA